MTQPTSICPKCGQPFDASRATYDKNGTLQCDNCAARGMIAEGDNRAANSAFSAAGGVLGTSIACIFCFNPFWLLSIATIASGISWLVMVGSNESLRRNMGSRYTTGMIMVAIGMFIASAPLFMAALAMVGIVLTR